jgi:DNA uptake protein ComE-like DNA-binding protein
MKPRPRVPQASVPRAVLHLVAVLSMAAALCVALVPTADAARSASPKHKTTAVSHKASAEKVDINTASLKDLEDLPGIGTVMAQKIMAGRPYKSVADLKHAGIPPGTIKGLTGKVKAGRSTAARTKSASHAAAASARAPEARKEAAAERQAEKQEARKSPPQRTFLGIPIGGSAKPAPKAEPAPEARSSESEKSSEAPRAAEPERIQAQQPPAKGMVWVNLDSKVYHFEGDRWYGTTRHGKFMWEDQAIREGYRASKTGPKK